MASRGEGGGKRGRASGPRTRCGCWSVGRGGRWCVAAPGLVLSWRAGGVWSGAARWRLAFPSSSSPSVEPTFALASTPQPQLHISHHVRLCSHALLSRAPRPVPTRLLTRPPPPPGDSSRSSPTTVSATRVRPLSLTRSLYRSTAAPDRFILARSPRQVRVRRSTPSSARPPVPPTPRRLADLDDSLLRSSEDTVGDLKKLIAAQTGTKA